MLDLALESVLTEDLSLHKNVNSPLAEDLRGHHICSMKDLLEHFVSKVTASGKSPSLETCIESVLSVANDNDVRDVFAK